MPTSSMKQNWILFLYTMTALLPLAFLVACSMEVGGHKVFGVGEDQANKASYSYEYKVNGCETGQRTFDSKDAYCSALLDENQRCAFETYELRQNAYKRECTGSAAETADPKL